MNARFFLASMFALAAASAHAQAPSPPPSSAKSQPPAQSLAQFGWFAELAGSCWRGVTKDGRPSDQQCYQSQYGRFLRGTIKFAAQGDRAGGEASSVFAFDPNGKVIIYSQWASTGAFGFGEARLENDELIFQTRAPDGNEAPFRSVWRRVDADTYRVSRERRGEEGGAWNEEAAVTYSRVRQAQATPPPPRS
jgi:hypothetical protein